MSAHAGRLAVPRSKRTGCCRRLPATITACVSPPTAKKPPPQCRGDAFSGARSSKWVTGNPGLCDPSAFFRNVSSGRRLYTRPGSLIRHPSGCLSARRKVTSAARAWQRYSALTRLQRHGPQRSLLIPSNRINGAVRRQVTRDCCGWIGRGLAICPRVVSMAFSLRSFMDA